MIETYDTPVSIKYRGQDYPVFLDSRGLFHATVQGQELSAQTFSELRAKAEKISRVKVDIPFTYLDERSRYSWESVDATLRDGSSTGFHVDGGLLLAWPGQNRTEKVRDLSEAMERLSDEDRDQLQSLLDTRASATKAIKEFKKAHKIDLTQLTREAVDQAGSDA